MSDVSRSICGTTEDDFLAAALAHMPRGRAWPREDDATQSRVLRGLIRSLLRFQQSACELLTRESFACYAIELLGDWERVLGLPDPCFPSDLTVAERQLTVCAKINALGGQSKAYLQAVATALGYEIAVESYKPFVCGLSECGGPDQFGTDDLNFVLKVSVTGPRVTWFEMGLSELGKDTLATIARADDLECRLEAIKPSGSEIIFSYEGA